MSDKSAMSDRRPELLQLGLDYLRKHEAEFIAAYVVSISANLLLSEEEVQQRAANNFLGLVRRIEQPSTKPNPRMVEGIRAALQHGETTEGMLAEIEGVYRVFTGHLQKIPDRELEPVVKEALLRRVRVIVDHHATNIRMIAANLALEKINNPGL